MSNPIGIDPAGNIVTTPKSKFAVGDIVVIATKAPKNPNAVSNLYVGQDAVIFRTEQNRDGELLFAVRLFVGNAQFWVTEDMLEPEVTDAMITAGEAAAMESSLTDFAAIYRAMRAVRRDKSKVGSQ